MDDGLPPLNRTAIRSLIDRNDQVWIHKDDLLGWLRSGVTAPPAIRRELDVMIDVIDEATPGRKA